MASSAHPILPHARALLNRETNDGLRPSHATYLDPDAFQAGEYALLLPALDARLSRYRYSLVSMLLAGIYFGLLTGHWLFAVTSWQAIAMWSVPVGLVCLYAVVTARSMLNRLRQLHETRAVIKALAETHVSAVPDEA